MRRFVLTGIGLALGAAPAVAQDRPQRAVSFGRPVAVPDPVPATAPAAPSGVTPVGLFSRAPDATRTAYQIPVGPPGVPSAVNPSVLPMPVGPGVPVGPAAPTMPGAGVVYPLPVATQTLPPPQPFGGPNVTELRNAPNGRPAGVGAPVPMGASVVVPSVAPDMGVGMPQLDDPTCPGGGCLPVGGDPGWGPRFGLFDRFFGDPAAPKRAWVTGEYLMWWTRSTGLPVLATSTTDPRTGGVLGAAGTFPVLGGGSFGETLHSGVRLGGGFWFNDNQCRGIDARVFVLPSNNTSAAVSSSQFPILTRPFFDVGAATQFGQTVAFPGFSTGAVAVNLSNSLWGAEANYRRHLWGDPCGWGRLDGLVGFRYVDFKEQLDITETVNRVPGTAFAIGTPGVTSAVVTDRFRTTNDFYGGQFGLTGEARRGRWFVDGRGTVAFGSMHQTLEVSGSQALQFANGTTATVPGGLLAVPGANTGRFTQNKFAVVPEVGVNLGYYVTPRLKLWGGFNFLYLSSVLRPADQINTNIDAARIPNFPLAAGRTPLPGTPQPTVPFRTTDLAIPGLVFGLGFTW